MKHSSDSAAELGLIMSLNAGVPLIHKDLMRRASFSELRHQSDVNSDYGFGTLLVDEPENKNNAKLWIGILHFRQRLEGLTGVTEVWHGMRRRGFDLPVSGNEADILWTTFLHASMIVVEEEERGSHKLYHELFKHALSIKDRTGLHYGGLYTCIIGRWLRTRPNKVMRWHSQLTKAGLSPPLNEIIADLALDAMTSLQRDRAIVVFRQLYMKSKKKDLYDVCIGEAMKRDVPDTTALYWHQLFIQNGDGPSHETFKTPYVQRLFELDKDVSLPMKRSREDRDKPKREQFDRDAMKAQYPPMTRATMNTIMGDVYGIKPKEISDNFCGRLFATRAFSLDLVIKGLSIFGVAKLGPIAVREMAIRAGGPVALSNTLNDLTALGISVGESVFSQLVLKLAKEGQAGLWSVLLESDQHPESYEDSETQGALLSSFLERHEWQQAHITLLALSLGGAEPSIEAWNRLLQYYLRHYQWKPMLNTMQSMQSQGLPLSPHSMRHLFDYGLVYRRPAKRPTKGEGPMFLDPLDFVTKALMYASEKGENVQGGIWEEILKRYGMDHRWDDVERVVLWLVDHYSTERSATLLGLDRDSFLDRARLEMRTRKLEAILTIKVQRAFLTWGFRSASVRNRLHPLETKYISDQHRSDDQPARIECEEWAQGLAFLKRLDDMGALASVWEIKREFELRMWMLFGPAYSTLGVNREARRVNQFTLKHYINHANEIWPGLVDWVDPALLEEEHETHTDVILAFFGPFRRVSIKRGEFANNNVWADTLCTSDDHRLAEAQKTPAEARAWLNSPVRVALPPGITYEERELLNRYHPLMRQSLAAPRENPHPPPAASVALPSSSAGDGHESLTQYHPLKHQSPAAHEVN